MNGYVYQYDRKLRKGCTIGACAAGAVKAAAAHNIKTEPVITTVAHINDYLSVDVWAKKNELMITDMNRAKEISEAILNHEPVGFYSDMEVLGKINECLTRDSCRLGIGVTVFTEGKRFEKTLCLIPKVLAIGIGCKKNTPFLNIENAVNTVLIQNAIDKRAVIKICSVDIKKQEPSIIALADKLNVAYETYTKTELMKLEGRFSKSEFVENITGADCVCERSAVLAAGTGRLIVKKYVGSGVTVAVARMDKTICF